MPSDTSKDVYVCKSIELTLTGGGESGWKPSVSSVMLSLTASDIPAAFVTIDPVHEDSDKSGIEAATPTGIGNLKEWNDRVQAIASDPSSTATLKIAIAPESADGGQEQSVTLTDWIVISGGIGGDHGGASAAGQFSLPLVLQHPAGRLDKFLCSIGSAATPKWSYQNYANPVAGLQKAFEEWLEAERTQSQDTASACAPDMPGAAGLGKAADFMKTQGLALVKQIGNTLAWTKTWPENKGANYSDHPMDNSCFNGDDGLKNAVRLALTNLARDPEDASVWDTIIHGLCVNWHLAVVPTYWDAKLQVMPYSPWANPVITIYDDQISHIAFPGIDPAPIGGAHVYYTTTKDTMDASWYNGRPPEPTPIQTAVTYLALHNDQPIGRVVKQTAPIWFEAAWKGDPAASPALSPTSQDAEGTLIHPEGIRSTARVDAVATTSTPTSRRSQLAGAAYRYAQELFLTAYRQQVEGSVNTCLLIRSDGSKWADGFVIPGCVVRIEGRDGKTMFDMYLTDVKHYLNAATGEAHTMLVGKYCRDTAQSGASNIVPAPTYNPVYAG